MNTKKGTQTDIFDFRLLKQMTTDASQTNSELGKKIGIFSPSAVSKRKKSLEERGLISGIKASLNCEKCNLDYPVVIFVRGKYGLNYVESLGEKLKKLPGILSIYNVSGDIDFVVFGVYRNRTEYLSVLDKLYEIKEIERTDTRQIYNIIKDFDYSNAINLNSVIISQ
ncbi:MAG: Lrp/AsnC family transcriptional regulator [Candidatus Thermoplasmatota archaeon]|jgi:Lrp/AsnC family transcriptional regulator for asnA, asnC and gidA|nr:Lrp/AsnC family transcriptional regulator [Candidatus Thermoplasmatota archaeon]